MVIQSSLILGIIEFRDVVGSIQSTSVENTGKTVENRRAGLESQMLQRWDRIYQSEDALTKTLEQFLRERHLNLETLNASRKLQQEFLLEVFPLCFQEAQNGETTGFFFLMTSGRPEDAENVSGFYVRDSDPYSHGADNTDLSFARCGTLLSRNLDIALSSDWTTYFAMAGDGARTADEFYYAPWRAARENPEANTRNLGYWAEPFYLEDNSACGYKAITYSIPLRLDGQVYAVFGIEINLPTLVKEFVADENTQSGNSYLLALEEPDGTCRPIAGDGYLSSLLLTQSRFRLEQTKYDSLYRVADISFDKRPLYASLSSLKLYSNNSPYRNSSWVLLGLKGHQELFGMGQSLYLWIIAAVLVGLTFAVAAIYVLVRHLTDPIQLLTDSIGQGVRGLAGYRSSGIPEIDGIYRVVTQLVEKQRATELSLQEEASRYRIALENTSSSFYTYNIRSHTVDVLNVPNLEGTWDCADGEYGFFVENRIHPNDRGLVRELFAGLNREPHQDSPRAEFRPSRSSGQAYRWMLFCGRVLRAPDGTAVKLICSLRNIDDEKRQEAQLRERNARDGVTGVYAPDEGLRLLQEQLNAGEQGWVLLLSLPDLNRLQMKNGNLLMQLLLQEWN